MASNVKLINIIFDLICFILVLVVFIVIKILLYGTAEGLYPYKREFMCGDTSIHQPVKEETIGYDVIDPLSFVIPIVVIMIVEACNNMTRSDENQVEEEKESYGPITLKPWIASMISLMVVFTFGGFVIGILTDLSKMTVGRLRPSFLTVCQANVTQADCQGYVTKDVCTGDPYDVKMARMSFPSGHASMSMYGMLFLAFYIQSAVRAETKLLKPLLQMVAVSLSLFAGLSRLAGNFHFLNDIVAGFILGAIIAWLIAFKVLKLFAIRIRKPKVYTFLPQQRPTSITGD
ncbi:Phospholipid phosphatase 3 [Desmophyllum pertusum]|uniref:Phospholipid phosphatase 3 n=1 Tax=Desmophyllum pertusum TaxID=174260 RepID=A0A9W9ZS95_9CNID|nr:Phospholipid phosphatase 3 [Desmophyllum pertusum]